MTMETSTINPARPITGRFVLFAMLAFFGVIIVVNVVMMSFALNTDNGLVVRNSYVASQDFNKNLAAARAQDSLGWSMKAELVGSQLRVRLQATDRETLDELTVSATVGRPVTDRDDQTVLLKRDGDLFLAPVVVAAGEWQADIRAVGADGQVYRRVWRFEVAADR